MSRSPRGICDMDDVAAAAFLTFTHLVESVSTASRDGFTTRCHRYIIGSKFNESQGTSL